MPRPRKPPRLYFYKPRNEWLIRDGGTTIGTGCSERDAAGRRLEEYLGRKHRAPVSATPTIEAILIAYGQEHVPHKPSARKIMHKIGNLAKWWVDKRVADITARNCRAYAAVRPQGAARADLETLRAAVRFWHKEYGPLAAVPAVTLPDKLPPRERWLTRSEAARLLWAARRVEHLRRFILLGLYTGSRSGAILKAKWDWIDLERGLMRRREAGTKETAKRTPPVRLVPPLLGHVRRWAAADAGRGYIIRWEDDMVRKLRRSWMGAVARAGLKGKITPHTLRHTRATWLMQDGVTIWDAAQMLGMSPLVLERVYGHHALDYQSYKKIGGSPRYRTSPSAV